MSQPEARKREPRKRRIAFRVTEAAHSALQREAHKRSGGNVSELARECVESIVADDASCVRETPSAAPPAVARSRKRTSTIPIRVSSAEAQALTRMARLAGYANRAVFIRSRLFAPLPLRLAGELGEAVRLVDELRHECDVDKLHANFLRIKAILLVAGAVPRA